MGRKEDELNEELINDQIKNLQDQGVEFHYDRSELSRKRRMRQLKSEQGQTRRRGKMLLVCFIFCVSFAALFIYFRNNELTLKGEKFSLKLEILPSEGSEDSNIKMWIIPRAPQEKLTGAAVLSLIFANDSADIESRDFPIPAGMVLNRDNPLFIPFSINKKRLFRTTRVRVLCQELGLEGKIRIR